MFPFSVFSIAFKSFMNIFQWLVLRWKKFNYAPLPVMHITVSFNYNVTPGAISVAVVCKLVPRNANSEAFSTEILSYLLSWAEFGCDLNFPSNNKKKQIL
jgi:hypothetical protein